VDKLQTRVVTGSTGEPLAEWRESADRGLAGADDVILNALLHRSRRTGRDARSAASQSAELSTLRAINARLLREIEVLKEREAHALRLADRDGLTGLYNRRRMSELLADAIAECSRHRQQLGLLFIDLDGFKRVNDRDGHVVGDRLLKSMTSLWACELRTTDVLGRIGGDEFGVILELTDADAAVEVVARLDRALSGPHRASTGVAVWDGSEGATALVARADANMYQHKKEHATR